jgi:hypothetical protein
MIVLVGKDLCKIKDDKSYEKWQHTCKGRREVNGELVKSKKSLAKPNNFHLVSAVVHLKELSAKKFLLTWNT